MEKKKMSGFEHAILSIADPEKAKEFEPYTYWEEQKIRLDNIARKEHELLSNMKIRDGHKPNITHEQHS